VRRSVAYQHGKPIFFMSASFHRQEEGLDHHAPAPADVPPPEAVPTMADRLARYPERLGVWATIPRPIDVRYVGEPGWVPPGDRPADPHQRVWMRIDGWSPSASGARGLATGRMFTVDGRHIASAVQEGLLRRVGA